MTSPADSPILTTNADGSYDYKYKASIQFEGGTYAAYDDMYDANGVHTARIFYDATGTAQASETYGPNGSFVDTVGGVKVLSETINADGSYDIQSFTPTSFYGVTYASYDDQYTSANVRLSRTFYDAAGTAQASETFGPNGAYTDSIGGQVYFIYTPAADGSYDNYYNVGGTFQGLAYAAYDNHYTSTGFNDQTSYYDGSGNLIGFGTYKQNGGYAVTVGGQVQLDETISPDGSYVYHYYTPVTFYNVTYASYQDQYNANNVRTGRTFYDASGTAQATETYSGTANYTDTIGGALYFSYVLNSDGSSDNHYYLPISLFGTTYASYDDTYSASGIITSRTFYDANGVAQAVEAYTGGGNYTDSIGGSLWLTHTANSDGSYVNTYAKSVTYGSMTYASYADNFGSDGGLISRTFYDANGVAQGTENAQGALAITNADGTTTYAYGFGQGLSPFTTWLTPNVVTGASGTYSSYIQEQAPGNVDPNHLDGIGALWLVAHLSTPSAGAPGALNLNQAKITLTIKGENFNPNGAHLYFWICSYLPGTNITKNYYAGLAVTNWAYTGDDLASQVTSDWKTITVTLDSNPADWTYAGNNVSGQGDWADRYQPLDLATTLSDVNATLHLVLVSASPSQTPTGYLDIANYSITTQQAATPLGSVTNFPQIVNGLENSTITGTVNGDASLGPNNISYALVPGSAQHGTVTLDAQTGQFSFTPDANFYGPTDFSGTASFQYTTSNGVTTDAPQTVDVFVGAVAPAPTVYSGNENVEIAKDTTLNFTLFSGTEANGSNGGTGSDPTLATLSFRLVPHSVHNGTLTLDATTGRYTFVPTAGFTGTASFQYYDTDGIRNSPTKTVTITVDPAGTVPPTVSTADAFTAYAANNDRQALTYWIVRNADAGDPNAAYYYGLDLVYGNDNVTRNAALGAQYLSKAAGTVSDATYQLALLYIDGTGVPKDYVQAQTLLNSIASVPVAQYELGLLDNLGFGAQKDDIAAAGHFLQAAEGGNVDAMYTLGRRYLSGTGVTTNPSAAYFWIETALKYGGGGPGLQQFIQLLQFDANTAAAQLDSTQIATIQQSVARWSPGQPTPYEAPSSYSYQRSATGTFAGATYTTIQDNYTASGVHAATLYLDASGTEIGEYDYLGGGSFSLVIGGVLTQTYTRNSDGSYDYHYFSAVNSNGVKYASYDDQYTSNNVRVGRTFYDASGVAQATETYLGGGAFTDTIGGNLYQTYTPGSGGTYDYRYYLTGTYQGLSYASYDNHYTSSGFRDQQSYFDGAGNLIGFQSYVPGGGYSVTVGGVLKLTEAVQSGGTYDYRYYTPVSFHGVTYASYDDQYSASNVRTGRTFYDASGVAQATQTYQGGGSYTDAVGGATVVSETVNADGSYDYRYYTPVSFHGVSYASYDDQYNASNVRTGRTFYDASGVAQATQTYLGGGSYTDAVGGVDIVTEMIGTDGSYDYRYYTQVSFHGVSYASYDDQYNTSNVRTERTFYDASGVAQATQTYLGGGSYTDAVGGVTILTETIAADGSYDYHYFTPLTFQGVSYASYDDQYTATNVRTGRTFYDASGVAQANETIGTDGTITDTVGGIVVFRKTAFADGSYLNDTPNMTSGNYTEEVDVYNGSNVRLDQTLTLNSGTVQTRLFASSAELDLANGAQTLHVNGDAFALGTAQVATVDLSTAPDTTLVVGQALGTATVTGFVASRAGADHLTFDHTIFADWAHLLGATQQVGNDLVITLDPTDTLTLKNTSLAAFQGADVHFA